MRELTDFGGQTITANPFYSKIELSARQLTLIPLWPGMPGIPGCPGIPWNRLTKCII